VDVDGKQNKNPKGDEEEETKDSVMGNLDKGKGVLQITQGESELRDQP
jgi:hypothetical protein